MTVLSGQIETLRRVQPMRIGGTVAALRGLTVLVDELPLPVGSLVSVGVSRGVLAPVPSARDMGNRGEDAPAHSDGALGEVVGFDHGRAIVMMLGQTVGLRAGDRVVGKQAAQTAPVGARLLGRVIDGLGRPIDGKGPIHETVARALCPPPAPAMKRRRITQALHTGVRAVDLMTTLGRGQRMGIFSGPGVGKSTLLGCIARNGRADVNVIALIGERGREVGDFIAHSLGPEGLARSVLVVATSDESPLMRIRAALVASAAAEYFRDAGRDVLLMMDSVTRFAHAQRQVGLSVGEPPATKGYTPSVFAMLPLLLERAGASERGSITGLYTVLVEGDDMTEPIADAARGILDGHIILSRKIAQRAHYPAIDVLDSVSRVAEEVCDPHHKAARAQVVRLLAAYRDVEELVQIGAYAPGSNPEADVAIEYRPRIMDLLRQGREERTAFEEARTVMLKIAMESGEVLRRRLAQPLPAAARAAGGAGSARG